MGVPRTSPLYGPDVALMLEGIRKAADVAGIGIVVTFADVQPPEHVIVNDGAASMLGGDGKEILKSSPWSREAGHEGTGRFEIVVTGPSGAAVPIEVASTPLDLGGRPAHVAFLFDLSTRKEAESALRRSEARFRAVVESSPDGVAILRGPRIVYLNPAAAKMLGYDDPNEGVGGLISDHLHPDDAPKGAQRIAQLIATGDRHSEPTEYRSRRKDGRDVTVELSSILIEYEGAPAVLGYARDITERKALQARLVEADRLAAVGSLAAGVAHEINNPLTYVALSLKYVERELRAANLGPDLASKLLARVKEASHGVDRVGTIVRDLKAFARPHDDAKGPVDVAFILDESVKIAENEIRHRARLIRSFQTVPRAFGNAARLEQVFLNLLVNAAQALPDGDPGSDEIRLTIKPAADNRILVEVRDTGPGISPEVRERIFDPFFTTKPVGVGTGLGLPICQSILADCGGSIEVDSEVGKGTAVRVYLRHSNDDRAREGSARAPSAPPSGRATGVRVLIVDDEPFVGRLLSKLLGIDHDIRVATSGQEALELLTRDSYDAILCDVMMPGMTGMELYAQIRQLYPGLEHRMIFMTGGAFMPKIAHFLDAVPNPRLDKPLDLDAIAGTIRGVIDAAAANPR